MPGGQIVVVMTRWHDDDLAGWLLENSRTRTGRCSACPPSRRSRTTSGGKPGDALWPESFPLDSARRRSGRPSAPATGPASTSRRPAPAEGGIFKAALVQPIRKPAGELHPDRPELGHGRSRPASSTTRAAARPGASARTATTCCRSWSAARIPGPEGPRDQAGRRRRQPDAVLIEDKASGQQLLQDLRRETQAARSSAITPTADKMTRASGRAPP